MPFARPVHDALDAAVLPGAAAVAPQPSGEAGMPAVVRLADDLAVPIPSPVHRLQAGLAHLTSSDEVLQDQPYPGWFRLTFPLAASAVLWGAIVWGFAQLA